MSEATLAPLPEDWQRLLVVVAHPDDAESGLSSAVARWTRAGKQAVYLLVTRGEAGIDALAPAECARVREAEEWASARVVGVETVEFLDGYRDGVVEYGLPLRRDLARAIRRHRPEVVAIVSFEPTFPGGFLNQADHRNVGLATLDAVRDAANRWIFPELLDEGHQPWGGTRFIAVNGATVPTHAVDVTDTLDLGIASLREHAAYLRHLGSAMDPDAFLRGQAAAAGQRAGSRYAVALQLIQA